MPLPTTAQPQLWYKMFATYLVQTERVSEAMKRAGITKLLARQAFADPSFCEMVRQERSKALDAKIGRKLEQLAEGAALVSDRVLVNQVRDSMSHLQEVKSQPLQDWLPELAALKWLPRGY